MRQVAVIGAGFGDEGKGKVVSHLCSYLPSPLVIRFSGGHQAGHRVMVNGVDHVFSNFGSGTIQGIPTYWSEHCTVDPVGLINEYNILQAKGVDPIIYLNERCPTTTPFDKAANLSREAIQKHGTCGVGVGQTHQREEEYYSLKVRDLFFPWVLKTRLWQIERYYSNLPMIPAHLIDDFLFCCEELSKLDTIKVVEGIEKIPHLDSMIFEGAQGLLLDQHYGFFPHVTRGNTGMTNITAMGFSPEIWLVTRAYQTRHGTGPMSNQGLPLKVKTINDHNRDDGHQGKFRIAPLDLSLLKYVINQDKMIKNRRPQVMVITCLDMLQEYKLTKDSITYEYSSKDNFLDVIMSYLSIDELYISKTPGPELIRY